MRNLLIFITILLSSCQTPQNKLIPSKVPIKIKTAPTTSVSERIHPVKVNHVYNRYLNKQHRYTQKQDGAPVKQKDISFKDPMPAKEPLSRYGNPLEYDVDGHTYQVLKSSTGYKTKGIASWYGTKFHKQRTSSGEPYDMYVMTAAHKTLPLPTYVRVKNLSNGRVAVVKVNDRGPFHEDRVIDLSYAAALKLGVFPKGTATVEIETLIGPAGQAHYYLQAGAFSSELLAAHLKNKLAQLTPSPVFIEHFNKQYLVRVGPFADQNMVKNLKTKLAQNGVLGTFSLLI